MNGASNAYEATRILINLIFNLDFRIVRIYFIIGDLFAGNKQIINDHIFSHI